MRWASILPFVSHVILSTQRNQGTRCLMDVEATCWAPCNQLSTFALRSDPTHPEVRGISTCVTRSYLAHTFWLYMSSSWYLHSLHMVNSQKHILHKQCFTHPQPSNVTKELVHDLLIFQTCSSSCLPLSSSN
jgi:hypothetical protein